MLPTRVARGRRRRRGEEWLADLLEGGMRGVDISDCCSEADLAVMGGEGVCPMMIMLLLIFFLFEPKTMCHCLSLIRLASRSRGIESRVLMLLLGVMVDEMRADGAE